MGTRHFIGVLQHGDYKIAQYGQWDGYFSVTGEAIFNFIKNVDILKFRKQLELCSFIKDEELELEYQQTKDRILRNENLVENELNANFISGKVSRDIIDRYPCFDRDIGAKILDIVYNASDKVVLLDNRDFLQDKLYCEYAYILDVDNETLTVYANSMNWCQEYSFSTLPSIKELQKTYDNSMKELYG